MPDHFAIFDEPRRPWLDAERLKEKFHALAATHHPDVARGGDADFTMLNEAYNILRDPKSRLRHLLELEFPGAISRSPQIPQALGDLFMRVGALLQRLDSFSKKQRLAESQLAKALLEPEKFSILDDLEDLLAVVNEHQTLLLDELRALDAMWQQDKTAAANRLVEVFQSLAFIFKWAEQLREGTVKLAM